MAEREPWLGTFAPLALPAFALGLSFGVLASQAGLSVAGATIMSATSYAGSAQFAAVSLLGAGSGIGVAVTAASLLNLRYTPMGIAVAPWFTGPPLRRFLESQMLVDESWILAQKPDGTFDKGLMLRIGLAFYAVWVTSTALGATFGASIGALEPWGLDAIVPAMFLGLLMPRLRDRDDRRVTFVAAALALVATPFTPQGLPVLIGMLAVVAGRRK